MERSESIKELAAAIAALQAEMKPAPKNALNPHFKSKYADLATICETLHPLLHKHGLSYMQMTDIGPEGRVVIETLVMHASGEWAMGRLMLSPTKKDPQGETSAITYARRYSLAAAFGLATEDDDGNAASEKPPAEPTKDEIFDKMHAASCFEHLENVTKKYSPIAKRDGWFREMAYEANAICKERNWTRKEGVKA